MPRTAERVEQLANQAREGAHSHGWKAEAWGWLYYLIALPATAFATVASLSLVADWSKTLAAVLAGASAVLTGLLTILRPQKEAAAHQRAWARYRRLQEDAELLSDRVQQTEAPSPTVRAAQEELKELFDRKAELDEGSPRAARKIFSRFRKD